MAEKRAILKAYQTKDSHMAALGSMGNGDRDSLAGGREAVSTSGGTFGSLTRWTGLGASMVEDLESTRKKYARVKRIERPEWVREQMEVIREEREAKAYAALDALLDSI